MATADPGTNTIDTFLCLFHVAQQIDGASIAINLFLFLKLTLQNTTLNKKNSFRDFFLDLNQWVSARKT